MKCPICTTRKAKRTCPAKQQLICTQCCGEKRVVEIACPPDCEFLQSGQSHQLLKKYQALYAQLDDPVKRQKLQRIATEYSEWLFALETAVLEYATDLRSLRDEEVAEAIALLRKTYETERRGVIFEHTSANPIVQSLSRDLRKFVESKRDASSEGGLRQLRLGELIHVLEVLEMDVQYHVDLQPDVESYLLFVRRNHPEVTESKSGNGLISLP